MAEKFNIYEVLCCTCGFRQYLAFTILCLSVGTLYLASLTYEVNTESLRLSIQMNSTKHMLYLLDKELVLLEEANSNNEKISKYKTNINDFKAVTKTVVPTISTHSTSTHTTSVLEAQTSPWLLKLTNKISCLKSKRTSLYLYHVRKAAGTTLRTLLEVACKTWHAELYETEGLVLDSRFLDLQDTISIITLREPIERVVSMYWYEHVGWWDGIVHDMNKCKTFHQWVDAWRDGSVWKKTFTARNPGSVYVEIENYYVKLLSDWKGAGEGEEVMDETHLERAKQTLSRFDLVLLSDQLKSASHTAAINVVLQIVAKETGHQLRGNPKVKETLGPRLASDESEVLRTLQSINKWDTLLWEYAKELVEMRMKLLLKDLSRTPPSPAASDSCPQKIALSGQLRSQLGIHRPPGHKGPLDGFYKGWMSSLAYLALCVNKNCECLTKSCGAGWLWVVAVSSSAVATCVVAVASSGAHVVSSISELLAAPSPVSASCSTCWRSCSTRFLTVCRRLRFYRVGRPGCTQVWALSEAP
eukprot:gene11854-24846_t